MGVYHWLIGSLMDEGDDFCQRLRKSVVGILFFPGSFLALYYVLQMLFFPGRAEGASRWMPFAVQLMLMVVYWAQYFLLRTSRHVGENQAAIIPWATTLLLQGLAWFAIDADKKPLWIALAMMAVLLQIPKIYFYLAFTLLLILVADWNTTHLEEADQMLAPDASYRSSSINRYIYACMLSGVLCVVTHNFIKQVAEAERRGKALKAANEMTLEILKYQRKYETEAIDKVLDKCKEVGEVEPDLIAMYETMNDNLKSYRPFLPNYLFQETEGEDEDEGVVSASGGQSSVAHRQDQAGATSVVNSDIASASHSGTLPRYDANSRNSSSAIQRGSSSGSRHDDSSSRIERLTKLAVSNLNKRGHLFEGRITFALVDINADRLTATCDGQGSSASIFRTITQMIYQLAKETKASVHSMLGDTVQLTWNATCNVALPETKGAVFLARLAKMSGPESVGLSAAICSGKASVHNITTDNQQALIIEAPWLPALEGCFDLAKQIGSTTDRVPRGCVLMDDRTTRDSALQVVSCLVEQVSYTENGKPSFLGSYDNVRLLPRVPAGSQDYSACATTMVHQLLGEQVRSDEEWMYQLQGGDDANGGSGEAAAVISTLRLQAVAAIADGEQKDAAEILKKLGAVDEAEDDGAVSKMVNTHINKKESPEFLRALRAACRPAAE